MQGKGLGAFPDIGELTMFADYRVPVVLRQLDILQYSPELAHKVLHHCCCTLVCATCQGVIKSYQECELELFRFISERYAVAAREHRALLLCLLCLHPCDTQGCLTSTSEHLIHLDAGITFSQVDDRVELPAGSEEEVEIRACTVWAVEQIMIALRERHGRAGSPVPHSVQLDWYLWEQGVRQRMSAPPNHWTITHFY